MIDDMSQERAASRKRSSFVKDLSRSPQRIHLAKKWLPHNATATLSIYNNRFYENSGSIKP